MPLTPDQYARLLAGGLSPQDIAARAGTDTAAAAPSLPLQASATTVGSPLAGPVGAATEALSGLKGVGIGAGGIGGLFLARRAFRAMRGAGKSASVSTASPGNEPLPFIKPAVPDKNFVTLTTEDLKHPEFSRFPEGYQMDRKTYQKALMEHAKPTPPGRSVKRAIARAEHPTRPIEMEGEPARAPAPTEEPKYTGGRGKSGAKLAREAKFKAGRGPLRPRVQAIQETITDVQTRLAAGEDVPSIIRSLPTNAAARAAGMATLRAIFGTGMQALPFLIQGAQGQSLEQQVKEAAPILEMLRSPEERRLIELERRYSPSL